MSQVQNLQKFPSMASVISTATTILPPGFVAKKYKPEKPFGPSTLSLMNRTAFGPGQRFCNYAFLCLGISILFIAAGSTYLGLRNVSRMIVFRTEFLGPFCIIMSIMFIGLAARLFYEARIQSNRWRGTLKFLPSGINSVVPYSTEDPTEELKKELQSGTFTDKAMKEVPRPGRGRGRSRFTSMQSLRAGRSFGSRLDNRPADEKSFVGMSLPEKMPPLNEGQIRYAQPPEPLTTGPTGRMPLGLVPPPHGLRGIPPMVQQRPSFEPRPRAFGQPVHFVGPERARGPPFLSGVEYPGYRPPIPPFQHPRPVGPSPRFPGDLPYSGMPQPRQPTVTIPKVSESEL